jgi:hypothetical protein
VARHEGHRVVEEAWIAEVGDERSQRATIGSQDRPRRRDEARRRGPSTGPQLSKETGERSREAHLLRQATAEEGGIVDEEAAPPLAGRGAAEEGDHVLDAFHDLEDRVIRWGCRHVFQLVEEELFF